MWLRYILFILSLSAMSCASAAPKLPEMTDMASMDFTVDGVPYDGIATVPEKADYNFIFKIPKKTVMFAIHNCNGEVFFPQVDDQTSVTYKYTPYGIEREGSCMLFATSISAIGETSFSMTDFVYINKQIPKETLVAYVQCNRKYISAKGSLLCQARGPVVLPSGEKKEGDTQRVCLDQEAVFAAAAKPTCNPPRLARNSFTCYDISTSVGQCVYAFGTKDNQIFRLTLYGYKGIVQ
jgi:hypothetical protein